MVRLAVPLTGRASPLRPGPAFPGNWRRQFLVKPYWASSPNSRSGGGGGGSRQASPLSLSSELRSSRCELCEQVVRADKQTNKLLLVWVIEWGGDVSAARTLLLVYYSLPAQLATRCSCQLGTKQVFFINNMLSSSFSSFLTTSSSPSSISKPLRFENNS